jgi:hypothetical protein
MSSKFAGLAIGVDTPSRMIIINPTSGQPLRNAATGEEAFIDLLSNNSSVGREHDRATLDQRIRAGTRRQTAEQIEADMVERLAKLTKGWSLVSLDGTPIDVECNAANARELFSMPELSWLRDAANAFAADVGNYKAAASKSC